MEICPVCKIKPLRSRRARYCGDACRYQAWEQRSAESARRALALPRLTLPLDMQAQLPIGTDHQFLTWKLLLHHHAPAGSVGYRLGTTAGQAQILHWFPSSLFSPLPMWRLEPFERAVVPVEGIYVVQYVDGECQPIGEARYTIEVTQASRQLRFCDGDRSLKVRSHS